MSKKLKRKTLIAIMTEIICLVLLGVFLTTMQTGLAVNDQKNNTKEKLAQMDELLANADAASEQTTVSYDEIYKAKADTLALLFQKQPEPDYSGAKLEEYRNLLNTDNVLLLDREGHVLAQAKESPTDFTYDRFNLLRTVFETGKASDAFEVQTGKLTFRYYGSRVNDQTMAVVEQNPEDLHNLLSETSTWESILSNVSVGLNGYAFAVSSLDYSFLYYPDDALMGEDALNAGIPVEELESNNYTWLTIDGQKLYCGITEVDDAYIVCAVTAEEIEASRNITVGIVLFAFFAVLTLVVTYSLLTMKAAEEKGETRQSDIKSVGNFRYNKVIGRKISTISIVGLIFILVISFYMQTLFSLSRQSMGNTQRAAEVEDTIDRYEKDIETTTEQYNTRYLNKCRAAAYILDQHPELASRDELVHLAQVLDVEAVYIFDNQGTMTASSSSYSNFQVSKNPKDQSYEFGKLLAGVEYVIQKAQTDELSGEYHQYIGVSLRDAAGDANGFVQISVTPSKLEEAVSNLQISKILDNTKVGKGGFVFAVNKEDHTFAYYPKEKLIGRKATAYGMEKSQLKDEYSDYISLDGKTYYGSSMETDHYYIYVVVPEKSMTGERAPVTLASGAFSLVCLILLFFLLTFSRKPKEIETLDVSEKKEDGPIIDVVMPDGTVKKSESAESRWANLSIGWNEKTPEQQIASVLKGIFGVLAIVICLAVLFKDTFFDSNSVFLYVLSGNWEKGVNIFAITGCIMIICVVSVATMIIRNILRMLSKTFGARGETVCRLLRSFVKYISVIAALYYCFALFGVDTKTLLASAGILSLVIGLGAKTLVSDILAGLFIIFEGEFRVGDIVTIGDWRGTVVEIGIRTTKIEDGGKNIKIISNSEVSGVINMTRQYSYAWADVGIEYGESLERVENILEKEFPNIKRRLPAILEGPFYKGVIALGDSSVNIRIMVLCAESDRIQMGRDLNREMKLLFDKYDINIPFPQVVLNEPTEYQKATEWEKWKADKFNESQKDLAKNLVAEEEKNQ